LIIIPVCAEWFAVVCFVAKNAGGLLINYLRTSKEYGSEKINHAAKLRDWFDKQIGIYVFFLISADRRQLDLLADDN
jgi:hypothetical protein